MTKKLMKLQNMLRISLAIGIVLLLAACGGSGGSSGGGVVDDTNNGTNDEWVSENNDRLGFVTFAEVDNRVSGLLDVDVEASFFAMTSELVAAFVALPPEIPVGTCVVTVIDLDLDDEDGSFSFPEIPDNVTTSMVSVDAGNELSVMAGNNGLPYTTLAQQIIEISGQTFYAYDNGTDFDDDVSAPPVPTDLSMIVPGATDGFPSMTVEIPNVQPMILNAPGLIGTISPAIPVDSTTTFIWVPREENDPESYVRIFAASPIPLIGNKYVECNVADTGTFSFSDATQTELVDFSGTLWDFSRVVRSVQVDSSGATIILDVERGISSLGGIGL